MRYSEEHTLNLDSSQEAEFKSMAIRFQPINETSKDESNMIPIPMDSLSESDMDLSVIPNEITTIVVRPKENKRTSCTGRPKLLDVYERRVSQVCVDEPSVLSETMTMSEMD